MENICFNCFNNTGGYGVCPYCGYVLGTKNTPEFMLQPGMRIWGRYIIGTILGIGGFGVTYKAFDTRLSSIVAIKEFFPQNLSSRMPGEGELRLFMGDSFKNFQIHKQRFVEEGKNLAKFTGDAHIVNVLDSFEDNNTAYIVMEYLEGVTLKEYMLQSGGVIEYIRATEIMKELLEGLKTIHLKGIIHRDISPDNIYVLRDGCVKILDFGAARFAAKEEWTQSVVVKKGYAPPEQYRNNMRQSEQTDLYAAGATFYKMLTGKTPEESIERAEKDTLQRPSKIISAIDAQTDKFIMKSIALKPELRFKNADAMLAALSGATGFDYPEEELKKIKRRRGLLTGVAALMIISVLGLIGYRLANGQSAVPQIVRVQNTLADENIQPDTITMWVSEHDNETGVYDQLAQEFMLAYPEHKVIVETVDWDQFEAMYDGNLEDMPDISTNYFDERADLTLLINGLDTNDYYGFEEYKREIEDGDEVRSIHTGFEIDFLVASNDLKNDENFYFPSVIDSVDTYTKFATQFDDVRMYDTLKIFAYYESDILDYDSDLDQQVYKPEVWEDIIRNYLDVSIQNQIDNILEMESQQDYNRDYIQLFNGNTRYYNEDYSYHEILSQSQEGVSFIPIINEERESVFGDDNNTITVNANSNENKQLVAMQFIHFILSEKGQTILNIQNSRDLPVNKAAMQYKLEYEPVLAELEPYFSYETDSNGWVAYELGEEFENYFENINDFEYAYNREYSDDDIQANVAANEADMIEQKDMIIENAVHYLNNYIYVDED